MALKDKIKSKVKNKAKKVAFKVLKPFLPFIIIFFGLLFAFCSVIDAIFVQEIQADISSMSKVQQEIRAKCIEKAEYLNTCHNYKGSELTNNLLDMANREADKEIQWSHLYAIMAFHNMTDNTEINESLLNKVASNFESTFKYETYTIKTETATKDKDGNESTSTKEETIYLLIESDTIMGHYKYNYEERTTELDNTKTTKKVFVGEELIGEKYERLKNYLKDNLHIREDDIDTDVQVVIQAASGYYEGEENTSWLQGNSSSDTIITDGKGLISKGMFIWPIPGYTTITSNFRYENSSNYSVHINYILGTDVRCSNRCKFCGYGRWNSYKSNIF